TSYSGLPPPRIPRRRRNPPKRRPTCRPRRVAAAAPSWASSRAKSPCCRATGPGSPPSPAAPRWRCAAWSRPRAATAAAISAASARKRPIVSCTPLPATRAGSRKPRAHCSPATCPGSRTPWSTGPMTCASMRPCSPRARCATDVPSPGNQPDTPLNAQTTPRVRRAALAFIFVTVLIDVLAFGVIIPVLPHLIEDFVGGDTANAAYWVGVFGTVFAGIQFVTSPIQGALSDRFGRRPVILLSCLGLGLDFVFMALANTLPWLLVGRVISGVTSASFTTANAYVADVTPPEKRAKSYGMIGAAFGLGFVVGPMLGGWLGDVHLRL